MRMEVIAQLLTQIFNLPIGNVKKYRINSRLPDDTDEGSWLTKILFEMGFLSTASESNTSESRKGQAQDADKACKNSLSKDKAKKRTQSLEEVDVSPPDISEGLGRNQARRDVNMLAQFAKEKAKWMVNQNTLYFYTGSHWKKLGQDSAIRQIRDIYSEYQDITEVLNTAEYKKLYFDLLYDPELEICGELTSPPGVVNFNDGEIDFSAEPPCVQKHDPSHHFTFYVDVSAQEVLNPFMSGATFECFASHVSDGNEVVRTQLLELLSIALTGQQLKHFYVLLGPSNSGKTQWGRFMEELLGRDQVATVRGIQDFGDRWTVGSLAEKKLATCLDLPDKILPSAAVGIIKQFCGDDPVKGEVKYANSFTYYQKPLLLFAGNHPIKLGNAHREEAFWNRMVVIPFANPVREEDMELSLYMKLLNEAPYIIHEAIIAYQELISRNYSLTRTEIPMEYQRSGAYGYDSVRDFIQNNLEERDGAGVSTKEIYEEFCTQADQDMSLTAFSRALAASVQDLFPRALQAKRINKAGERGYRNLGFISNA